MPYYFINLTLHLMISCGILFLILVSIRQNKTRKTKRGFLFLLPVLLTLIFLFQSASFTIPRALDMIYVLKNNYRTIDGVVTDVGYLNNTMMIDDQTYYFNPFLYKPEEGDQLTVLYTPYARFVGEVKLSSDR
jgi:hypothetical protein